MTLKGAVDMRRDLKLRGVPLGSKVQAQAVEVKVELAALSELAHAFKSWASTSTDVLVLPALLATPWWADACQSSMLRRASWSSAWTVSYTHLTLPTKA